MSIAKNILQFTSEDTWAPDIEKPDYWGALLNAAEKIAPVWPLENFVAVNPYLGLMDRSWDTACTELCLSAGAKPAMDISFYETEQQKGSFSKADVDEALLAHGCTYSQADLWDKLRKADSSSHQLPLLSDIYGTHTGIDATDLILDQISGWAAGFYDQGQSKLALNIDMEPMFQSWQAHQAYNKSLDLHGMKGLSAILSDMSADPKAAAERMLADMALPNQLLPLYLHRLARSIGGWMAYARYKDWPVGGDDRESHAQILLTIRLAYEWYCHQWLIKNAGKGSTTKAYKPSLALKAEEALKPWLVIQEAYENGVRRDITCKFSPSSNEAQTERPSLQAAFCIDVRSEVYRRALEQQGTDIETIGFAGFFGLSLDVHHTGSLNGNAHCPVLLEPQYTAKESSKSQLSTNTESQQDAVSANWFSYQSFRSSAVSSFAFVESFGLLYLARAVTDALGISKPAAIERSRGIAGYSAPESRSYKLLSRTGEPLTLEEKSEIAQNILTGMSLTENLAPLVFLVGHGSTSINNPHAAGLDCGACGGNSGAPNAQVVASLLNEDGVREVLGLKGITIPKDTVFVAALHDTTTDTVTFLDCKKLPETHKANLEAARTHFDKASIMTSKERSLRFDGVDASNACRETQRRSNNWSEVRPEWGLAGCKAFVAAPRQYTRSINLNGHAFLHSYNHEQDEDYKTLELIMTAPMIVASWINLQYFGSTVDNTVFGSGDKTLHNVVGRIGVLEGGSGDLRVGLPKQSLHDGKQWMHSPARLSVILRAPVDAINQIIQKHEMVQQLADNKWLYLYAMDDDGAVRQVYEGSDFWTSVSNGDQEQPRTVA